MMKFVWIRIDMRQICASIICSYIRNYKQRIQNIHQQHEYITMNESEQIKAQISEQEMREAIKVLKSLSYVVEDWNNRDYFISIFNLHEILTPLLFSEQHQCTEKLLDQVFSVVSLFAYKKAEIQKYLIEKHQILTQLSSFILQFANQLCIQSNQTKEQVQLIQNSLQSTKFSPSPLILTGILWLLHSLLTHNPPFATSVLQVDKLIQTLVELSSFGITTENDFQYKQIISNDIKQTIRGESIRCLSRMQENGSENIQYLLVNKYNYIQQSLIQPLSCAGGSCEQSSEVIVAALNGIYWLFILLRKGKPWYTVNIDILRCAEEQIEFVGGIEEFESNMFHTSQLNNQYLQNEAKDAKKKFLQLQ